MSHSPEKVHIFIQSPAKTPRLRYVLEVLLGEMLGVSWELIQELPPEAASCVLHYGTDGPGISIPASGLLTETHIRTEIPSVSRLNKLPILFAVEHASAFSIPFDVLAASFYLLAEYETRQVQH
ncbi:MAG: hypothetical protein AAFV07_04205, partial [Bacteroidota bacterium]